GGASPVAEARGPLHVERDLEARVTARAHHRRRELRSIARSLSDQDEDLQDRAGRQGRALALIEPERSARLTDVDRHGPPVVPVEWLRRHLLAASGARGRHGSGERRAALRTELAGTIEARLTARARHDRA